MASRFAELAFTPAVKAEQSSRGSRSAYARLERNTRAQGEQLGPTESAFIAERDSFYIASVSETGWPYVQHRGGPPGFVKVLDPKHIGFADYPGNRQYITLGNLARSDRVALIFMDYPAQRRLKLLGHARRADREKEPDLFRLLQSGFDGEIQGGLAIEVEATDWNCPQYITPRYTAEEVEAALAPLRERLRRAEAELDRRGRGAP